MLTADNGSCVEVNIPVLGQSSQKEKVCVQGVTAKGHPKFEKQERKKQLSGYRQCYTSKLTSFQMYEFGSHYVQQTQS